MWQAAEAVAGYHYAEGRQRLRKRAESVGRTLVYLALCWLAVSNAAGIAAAAAPRTV